MASAKYALAKHAFVCLSDDHVMILDVRCDRYRALSMRAAGRLGALVEGWPVKHPGAEGNTDAEDAASRALAEDLVAKGVLAADPALGKDATPVNIPRVVADLTSGGALPETAIGVGVLWAFIVESLVAAQWMKRHSFEQLLQKVQRRSTSATSVWTPAQADACRRLVHLFGRLRPWLFASRDACLFESLVLLRFLARHGIAANWVFGVRMKPWGAHCWLQHADVVLSDTSDAVETVNLFTPIMVV
jgi:hypothetical protein